MVLDVRDGIFLWAVCRIENLTDETRIAGMTQDVSQSHTHAPDLHGRYGHRLDQFQGDSCRDRPNPVLLSGEEGSNKMTLSANSDRGLETQPIFAHGINHVAVSPNGLLTAMSDVDMNVRVESKSGIEFKQNFHSKNEKIRPTDRVRGLSFSADGLQLFVASGDRVLSFSTITWFQVWEYVAPRSFGFLIISPIALGASRMGDFVGAFDNGSMTVWSEDGVRKQVIRDNDSPRWLRFADDGASILGTDSFSVCRWKLSNGVRKDKIALKDHAFGFAADSKCQTFAIRTLSEISLWDFDSREMLTRFPVSASIPLLAFHPSLPLLVCGEQNRIKVVDYAGEVLEEYALDVASALSIGFSVDGSEMLVGCTDLNLIRCNFPNRSV